MPKQSHRKVIAIGSIAAALMFGFCFAIAPFYSLICKATGISTSIPSAELARPAPLQVKNNVSDETREVTIQFLATNHMGMPFDFYPRVKTVQIHLGKNTKVFFYIKNTTDQLKVVQAIPSMTPTDAIGHFHKIECFCFRQQTLAAHESKEMPLIFNVDKDLPKEERVITLAYTLFDVTPKEKARKG